MATEPSSRTYWCFLSYRHSDNREPGRQWATWLHHEIETYEVPKDLVGTKNERGEPIPSRIFPVFRDEEELPADADLATPIFHALENSRYLVVLCSPRAVQSTYVEQEITYFKQLGRANRVLALMIDGEPNARWDKLKSTSGCTPEMECFPRPLRHQVDSSGNLLPITSEPIAADMRLGQEQGWTSPEAYRQTLIKAHKKPAEVAHLVEDYTKRGKLAVLKIIAGILGIPLGTLTKRDFQYQLEQSQQRARNLRRWLAAVGGLAFFALVGGGLAIWEKERANAATLVAQLQKAEAEKQRGQAEKLQKEADLERDKAVTARKQAEEVLRFLVTDLHDELVPIGRLDILKKVNDKVDDYYKEMGIDPGNDDQLISRATALVNDANLLRHRGSLDEALKNFKEAVEIDKALIIKNPSNAKLKSDLSGCFLKIADVLAEQGKLDEADQQYQTVLETMRELVKNDSTNHEWQNGLGVVLERVGDLQLEQGKGQDSYQTFQECLAIRQKLTQIDPENNTWEKNLAIAYERIGDAEAAQGKLDDSLTDYQREVNTYRKLLQLDAQNANWNRDFGVALEKVGSIYTQQNKLDQALDNYQKEVAIDQKLVEKDPTNSDWLSSLGISIIYLADTEDLKDNPTQSLKDYKQALDIEQKLVTIDATNMEWEGNLGIAYMRVGDLEKEVGQPDAARKDLTEAESIIKRLLDGSPNNPDLQTNYKHITDGLASLGN